VKIALPRTGPGVRAPTLLGVVLLVDLVLAAAVAVAGPLLARSATHALALAGYGAAVVAADLAAARMSPAGLTWRRRLGYVAILAVVWRGGPLEDRAVATATVLWTGFVWVALVVGGRALSRAIASVTGEDRPE
jgi:hypothetical protein